MKKLIYVYALIGLFACGCNNHANEDPVEQNEYGFEKYVQGEIIARHDGAIYAIQNGGEYDHIAQYTEDTCIILFDMENDHRYCFFGRRIVDSKCLEEGILLTTKNSDDEYYVYLLKYENPDEIDYLIGSFEPCYYGVDKVEYEDTYMNVERVDNGRKIKVSIPYYDENGNIINWNIIDEKYKEALPQCWAFD